MRLKGKLCAGRGEQPLSDAGATRHLFPVTTTGPSAALGPLAARVRRYREAILSAANARGAEEIRLVGSVARGEECAGSDIDFLVRLAPGRNLLDLGGIQYALERLLGCRVDVISERGLKAPWRDVVLRDARPL